MGAWTTQEPAETLGDTTPGALDQLPQLEHPAVTQAREDTRLPSWFPAAAVTVLALVSAYSVIWPMGPALSY